MLYDKSVRDMEEKNAANLRGYINRNILLYRSCCLNEDREPRRHETISLWKSVKTFAVKLSDSKNFNDWYGTDSLGFILYRIYILEIPETISLV